MALLVTDNGEIDSLRNLLNYNQEIPRNLILKLFTTNTYPAESDTPSQTRYYGAPTPTTIRWVMVPHP